MVVNSGEDRLVGLARDRAQADAEYNARLTAADASLPSAVAAPSVPQPDHSALQAVNGAFRILPDEPAAGQRAVMSLKGRLRAFIWRLVGPPLTQQQHFNASLVDHLNRAAATERELHSMLARTVAQLTDQRTAQQQFDEKIIHLIQAITAYVDTRDRHTAGAVESALTPQITAVRQIALALKRDLERTVQAHVATAHPSAEPAPGTSALTTAVYVDFEDQFRGTQADIRARVQDYIPLFVNAAPVLDVGCGRGEVLDLFRDAGIAAKGIDINPSMVDICRERGLDATATDAVAYLESQPDATLGGLIAIQVVEHFDAAYLSRFLELAFHKLKPGASIVLETINPTCWVAFFESYIRDTSHRHPLHPETLRFLVQAHGFSEVGIQLRSPVTEGGKLQRVALPVGMPGTEPAWPPALADLVSTVNANADKLNARLFTYMDYAIIARR